MKADERRKAIANLLTTEQKAVSGAALSAEFGVSRQIIVQDITALRSSGYDIISTHNGYLIQKTPLKELPPQQSIASTRQFPTDTAVCLRMSLSAEPQS